LINRLSTDGSLVDFYKDGSSVGSIGSASGGKMSVIGTNQNLQIGANGANVFNVSTTSVYPETDNATDLGFSSSVGRWKDLYLSGNLNSSGATLKNDSSRNSWAFTNESVGIGRIEAGTQLGVADDATVTLTFGECGACLIHVYDQGTGKGAIFFANFSAETSILAQSGDFATSDSDGNYCVYKSTSSHTVTFKNRTGATRNMGFLIVGAQAQKA